MTLSADSEAALSPTPLSLMGRKSNRLSVSLSRSPSEWWGDVRGSVRYLHDKLPQKLSSSRPRKASSLAAVQSADETCNKSTKLSESQVCENSQLTTIDGATQLTDRSISDQLHPMTTNFVNKGDESCQQQDEASSRQPQQQLNSSCMRSRLSSIIPRYEKLETKVRSVRCDMRKLRSKSCDGLIKRRKSGNSMLTIDTTSIVAGVADTALQYDEEYFQKSTTLRKSRRMQMSRRKYTGPFVGLGRAKVDCVPSPYDNQALPYKAGDLIRIIRRGSSGNWYGEANGRIGNFKFINIEELQIPMDKPVNHQHLNNHTTVANSCSSLSSSSSSTLTCPSLSLTTCSDSICSEVTALPASVTSVPGLLCHLDLAHLTSRLILHGWDSLPRLSTLVRTDLDYLGIIDRSEQDRLLAAVAGLPVVVANPSPSLSNHHKQDMCNESRSNRLKLPTNFVNHEDSLNSRTLSRMDSGYYDIRDDVSSNGSRSGSSIRVDVVDSDVDSLQRMLAETSVSSTAAMVANCVDENDVDVANSSTIPEAEDLQAETDSEEEDDFTYRESEDTKWLEKSSPALVGAGAALLARRRVELLTETKQSPTRQRLDSLNDSKLSIAEPNPQLNKSF